MLRLVYSRTFGGVQQPTHGKFTAFYRDAMGKGALMLPTAWRSRQVVETQ